MSWFREQGRLLPAQLPQFPPSRQDHIDLTDDQDDDRQTSTSSNAPRGPPQIAYNPIAPSSSTGGLEVSHTDLASTSQGNLRIGSRRVDYYTSTTRGKEKAWEQDDSGHRGYDMSSSRGKAILPQDPTTKKAPIEYHAGNGNWSNPATSKSASKWNSTTARSTSPTSSKRVGSGRGQTGPPSRLLQHAMQGAVGQGSDQARRNPTQNLPTNREPTVLTGLGRIGRVSEGSKPDPVRPGGRASSPSPSTPAPVSPSRAAAIAAEQRAQHQQASTSSASPKLSVRGQASTSNGNASVRELGISGAAKNNKGKGKATEIVISDDEAPEHAKRIEDDDIEDADSDSGRRKGRRYRSTSKEGRLRSSLRGAKTSSPDPMQLGLAPIKGPFEGMNRSRAAHTVGPGAKEAAETISRSGIPVHARSQTFVSKMQPRGASKAQASYPRNINGDGDPNNDLLPESKATTTETKFVPVRKTKERDMEDQNIRGQSTNGIGKVATQNYVVEIRDQQFRPPIDLRGDCELLHNSGGPAVSHHLTLRCDNEDVCYLRFDDVAGTIRSNDAGRGHPLMGIHLSKTATTAKTSLARACRFAASDCEPQDVTLWLLFVCDPFSELPDDSHAKRILNLLTKEWPEHAKSTGRSPIRSELIGGSGGSIHLQHYNEALDAVPPRTTRRQSSGMNDLATSSKPVLSTRATPKRDELEADDTPTGLRASTRTKRVPRKAAEAAVTRLQLAEAESTSAALAEQYAWQIEDNGTPLETIVLVYPLEGDKTVVSVTHGDTKRLADGKYLNDTLIEYGLKRAFIHLLKRDLDVDAPLRMAPQVHMFNSFFYKKLDRRGVSRQQAYDSVFKWTAKFDLFEKKFVIVPIHEKNHWYLAIIFNPGAVLKGRLFKPKPPRATRRSLAAGTATPTSDSAASPITAPPEPLTPPPDIATPIETSRFFPIKGGSKLREKGKEQDKVEARVDSENERVDETQESDSAMDLDVDVEVSGARTRADVHEGSDVDAEREDDELLDGPTVLASIPNRDPAAVTMTEVATVEAKGAKGNSSASSSDAEAVARALVPSTSSASLATPSMTAHAPLTRTPTPIAPSTRPPGSPSPPSQSPKDGASTTNRQLTLEDSDDEGDPTERCWILTFDSLGDAHRPVVKNLMDYLRREAKAKKDLDIAEDWFESSVEGVTVDVPQQENCSDCGLYLIHYVEQFLSAPDKSLHFILRYRGDKKIVDKGKNLTREEKVEKRRELNERMESHWRGDVAKAKRRELREEVKALAEQWATQRKPIEEEEARKRKEKAERKKAQDAVTEETDARLAAQLAEQRAEKGDDLADLSDSAMAPVASTSTALNRPKRSVGGVETEEAKEAEESKQAKESTESRQAKESTESKEPTESRDDKVDENGKSPAITYGKKGKAAAATKGARGRKPKEMEVMTLSSDDESTSPSSSPVRPARDVLPVSAPFSLRAPAPRRSSPPPLASTSANVKVRDADPLASPPPTGKDTSAFKKPRMSTSPLLPTTSLPAAATSAPILAPASEVDEAEVLKQLAAGVADRTSSPMEIVEFEATKKAGNERAASPARTAMTRATRSRDEAGLESGPTPANKRQARDQPRQQPQQQTVPGVFPATPFSLPPSSNGSSAPLASGSTSRDKISTRNGGASIAEMKDALLSLSDDDLEIEMPPSAQTPRVRPPTPPRPSSRSASRASTGRESKKLTRKSAGGKGDVVEID